MKYELLFLWLCIALCDAGRSCLSCSGIEGADTCLHHITCTDDEVCYMTHYSTESGKDNYDFGCSLQQVCPSSVGVFVGKRSEGRHTMCFKCCNETDLCNQNLQCDNVTPQTVTNLPKKCSDIIPVITSSGVYTIYPFGIQERPVRVHCIVDGHIWTVIQQRSNGSGDFYRDWNSYKHGFGSPYGAYWLGNDIIHAITSSEHHSLLINMSDFDAVEKYAEYNTFHVGDESSGYRLYVNGYSGNAGDSFSSDSGSKFSTYDKDNDRSSRKCALVYKGAWWFNDCVQADLNGEYLYGRHILVGRGVYWYDFKESTYSLKSTLMMIRRSSI